MNGLLTRGGAAALLLTGLGGALAAQDGGGPRRRDSVIVRIIDPQVRARLDSIHVLMREFDEVPASSEASLRIRQAIESLTVAMWRMQPEMVGPGRPESKVGNGHATRLFFKEFDGPPVFERRFRPSGWIGITTDAVPLAEQNLPTGHFVQYFAHPAIISVEYNSPAQQAGILPGDSLIAYDGVDVVGHMLNLTEMLVPDRKLGITVRRLGEKKEYSVTVAKVPERIIARARRDDDLGPGTPLPTGGFGGPSSASGSVPVPKRPPGFGRPPKEISVYGGQPRAFVLSGGGAFGASMTTFESAIAKKLDLPAGVLVKDVPESTIAAKAGLEPGDVIVAVAGHTVTSLQEVQMLSLVNGANHSVALTIIRDKKPRTITVTWPGDRP